MTKRTLASPATSLLLAGILATLPLSADAKPKETEKSAKKQAAKTVKVPDSALKKPVATPVATAAPATPAPEAVKELGNLAGPDFDISKEPTNISANSLTLLNEKRTFTYEGKVVVTQGDMTLTCDTLDGNYSDKNEIQKITARQNVEIIKGADMKAHGQRAEYDAVSRTIVLTETPSVEQNGSILSADIIRIFIDENRSTAEGNVKVTLKNTGDGLKGSGGKTGGL